MSSVTKWFVHETRHGVKHILDVPVPTDETAPLLTANGTGRRLDVDTDAILQLAAAAPDLLDALKYALSALNAAPRIKVGATDSYKIASMCEKAIAKATGGVQ